jgi:hypothetical protein
MTEVWETQTVEGLSLEVRSFADMTIDRAAAVARAFDVHSYLRPLRVGGDPARIKVEPTMEAVLVQQGLPVEWLTERRSGPYPDFEGGQIDLLAGRGGWTGSRDSGEWEFSLTGHQVKQHWCAATMTEPAAVAEVAQLLEDLVIAADAAYAYATPDTWKALPGSIRFRLPGVFWLNYFGPAFVFARPQLAAVSGARTLSAGGVLVRTTDSPWQPATSRIPGWQRELRGTLGEQAFEKLSDNPSLPAVDEHVAASPCRMEMPWAAWLAGEAIDDRKKKHASAKKRLAKALEERAQPVLPPDAEEWSASFDMPEWQEFGKYLTRELRGEFSTAVGKAAMTAVATAPVEDEGDILLRTQLGAIRLGWFIDDHDTVDVYIFGSRAVRDLCERWNEQ